MPRPYTEGWYQYHALLTPGGAEALEVEIPGVLAYVGSGWRRVRARDWEGSDRAQDCTIDVPVHAAWLVERSVEATMIREPAHVVRPWSVAERDRCHAQGVSVLDAAVARGEMTDAQRRLPTSYQVVQAGWCASRPWSLLVWAPGAGKTFGAICGILATTPDTPVVIVAPGGVRAEWWSSFLRFTRIKAWRQKPGPPAKRDQPFKDYLTERRASGERPVLIGGHEMIEEVYDLVEASGLLPGIVVFDEIHWLGSSKRWEAVEDKQGEVTFRGKRTKGGASERRAYTAMLLSRLPSVQKRIGLTGTPFGAGRPRRLWAQFDLLDPGGFSHAFRRYAARYCDGRDSTYSYDDSGSSNLRELRARANWFMHFVPHTASHSELPPTRVEVITVPREDQCASGRFEDDTTFGQAIRRAGKRRATASEIAEIRLADAASRKRKRVVREALEGVKGGGRVLIFTTRKREVEEIAIDLRARVGTGDEQTQARVLLIHGDIAEGERQRRLDDYCDGPGGVILVATGHSIGTGKDGMQYTDLALFAGLPWQADQFVQWKGRFDRLGDPERLRSTLLRVLIAEGTYDEHVQANLVERFGSVQAFFETDDLADIIDKLTESDGADLGTALAAVLLAPITSDEEEEAP